MLAPQEKMAAMVKHLASLADDRLIISFAPSTPALLLLKRIGEFFPKGSKVRLWMGCPCPSQRAGTVNAPAAHHCIPESSLPESLSTRRTILLLL